MAEFNASIPQVDLTPSVAFDPLAALKARSAQLGVQQQQMANDYTAQVQPGQINLMLSGLNAMNPQADAGSPVAAQPSPTAPSGWQPPPGSTSMLTGPTPISADSQTQQLVGKTAAANGVNPDWAMRIHYAESGASPTPFGPGSASNKGAIGPMQLEPATAKELGVNPDNLQQNIDGGVAYLGQMKRMFGNPVLATAAYNAGPGRVNDFLAGKASLPAETVNYVGKVFGNNNGAGLLNAALTGEHGHRIPGYGDNQPTAGLQPQAADPAATAAVRQLLGMRSYFMSLPNGTGTRAVAQIQAQLDNIAGPTGIIANDGMVHRVYGADATRYSAAQATEAGKAGPQADLYRQNEAVRTGGESRLAGLKAGLEQQTNAERIAAETGGKMAQPMKVSPNEQIVVPGQVIPGQPGYAPPVVPASPISPLSGIGANVQPAPNALSGVGAPPAAAPPAAPNVPTVAPSQSTPIAPAIPAAPMRQGVYQAPPVDPQVTAQTTAATKGAEMDTAAQQPILDQAKESQNALNRIGQVRAAIKQAAEGGLPPGFFSPALAEAAAGAKSLGIDLSSLGIDPKAIGSQQVANEAIAQINGEILHRMFPTRITDSDVRTFGSNLPKYGMDPGALDAILNQAQQSAQYDVSKAHDLLAYKAQKGNLNGWDTQFYKANGFGPDLLNAVKSGTVPAGPANSQPSPPASTTAALPYTLKNPAQPKTRADAMALPSGTPFLNPATGQVIVKH